MFGRNQHNRLNELLVYLGGNVNHNAHLSIEVDWRIRNAWCSFRKYTLELYDLPSAPLELKIRMLRVEVFETMLYGLRHVELARVPLRHAAPSPPQLPDSLHRLAKNNCVDHPTPYLNTLIKTGIENTEATLRRKRILFAEFVARIKDMRLPKCVMFGELVGGAGCVGGQEKEWMECFLDHLKASGISADQWTTTAQDEGGWRRTLEQGANILW